MARPLSCWKGVVQVCCLQRGKQKKKLKKKINWACILRLRFSFKIEFLKFYFLSLFYLSLFLLSFFSLWPGPDTVVCTVLKTLQMCPLHYIIYVHKSIPRHTLLHALMIGWNPGFLELSGGKSPHFYGYDTRDWNSCLLHDSLLCIDVS